jgi:hypothetical protein
MKNSRQALRKEDMETGGRSTPAAHMGRRILTPKGRYIEGERRPAGYLLAKRRAADAAEPDRRARSRS